MAAIKNESAESQAADTAAITKEADEQLAPYRSDSAFETASIKIETNKIESEEEVAGNVSKNLAAEKAFVTDTDQQEANQTLLNVQTNVEWFGKQIESSRSFSPKQKFSLMDTFNGLKEDLAVIDLSNNSEFTKRSS